MVLIQGASGCGKTSALSFLRGLCSQLPKDAGQGGAVRELLVLDLQDQDPAFKERLKDETEKRKQIEQFLSSLVDALDGLLKKQNHC